MGLPKSRSNIGSGVGGGGGINQGINEWGGYDLPPKGFSGSPGDAGEGKQTWLTKAILCPKVQFSSFRNKTNPHYYRIPKD